LVQQKNKRITLFFNFSNIENFGANLAQRSLKKVVHYFKKCHYNYKNELYKGAEVALLTKHAKEQVIAPLLHEAIGCRVKLIDGYDTDLLGTFSRDIARRDSQIETARKKANIAIELSNLRYAVASEGSFGLDPYSGMFAWNTECLIWVDRENDLEIIVTVQSKTNLDHAVVHSWQECEEFAHKIEFPQHYLIIRPQENSSEMCKGVSEWSKLKEAFLWARNVSQDGSVFIETDMRAFANPTRMKSIEKASHELVKKLSSLCPLCNAPGYDIVDCLTGLECRVCHNPTQEISVDIYGCVKCKERIAIKRKESDGANPAHCDFCNP